MFGAHPRWGTHPRRERAPAFALQINAEAMSVLGVLQQKPGAAEWLLAGRAGVAAGLIFTFGKQQRDFS